MACSWTLAARPPCPCRRRRRWQSPRGAAEADGVEVVAAHHARGLASGRQIASVNLRQRNGHERLLDFTGTLEILLMNLERAALGFHSLFELAVARLETAPGARVQFYTAGKQHHDDNYNPVCGIQPLQVFASRVSSMRRFPTAAGRQGDRELNATKMTQYIGGRAGAIQRRIGRSNTACSARMGNRYSSPAAIDSPTPPNDPVITYQVSAESPTAIPTVIATTRVTRIALMLSLTLVSLVQNGPLASTGSIAEYRWLTTPPGLTVAVAARG